MILAIQIRRGGLQVQHRALRAFAFSVYDQKFLPPALRVVVDSLWNKNKLIRACFSRQGL
jgi:hypothetical protein